MTLQNFFAQAASGAAQHKSVEAQCTITPQPGNHFAVDASLVLRGPMLYHAGRFQRLPPPSGGWPIVPLISHWPVMAAYYPPVFDGQASVAAPLLLVALVLRAGNEFPLEHLQPQSPIVHSVQIGWLAGVNAPQPRGALYVETDPTFTLLETPAAGNTVNFSLIWNNVTDFTVILDSLKFV